ncbi:DUF418 domain-containing protein [Heliorestis acidaminivorans]|uniref:DUF418 domain-containing protein n=1 Tax=Heliorestis acidaminivorans TaxID=553427 RepID=A0A6I0EV94_9FIRM|nr:DUF418 domain-containing protein [Heliorestis acidaminivorans]KAB2953394.1 DUF418 domain-containing protein [Heliorestis acidaminivorans]
MSYLLATSLQPTAKKERIIELDILRGLALLGILIVNMAYFNSPIMYSQLIGMELWEGPIDRVMERLIFFFGEGKFYTMFSFLFGLGFIIFIERAKEKVTRPRLLFLRRLASLLVFGLIHAFFFWYGDILTIYGLVGLLLLFFVYRQPRTLLIWTGIMVFLYFILIAFQALGAWVNAHHMDYSVAEQEALFTAQIGAMIEQSYLAYGQGTWSEVMAQRVADNLFMYSYIVFAVPIILPMFLLGAYVGKKGWHRNLSDTLPLLRKIWLFCLLTGLPLTAIKTYAYFQPELTTYSFYYTFYMVGMILGDPLMSFFYMTSMVLLVQKPLWRQRFDFLRPLGQMALTNYLMQTLFATTIFYSYGLGLYGQVGPALSFLIALLIFSLQVLFSRYWLSRYPYGPMERLWRTMTYGKLKQKVSSSSHL